MKDFRNFYRSGDGSIYTTVSIRHKVNLEDVLGVIEGMINLGGRVTKAAVFERIQSNLWQEGTLAYTESEDDSAHREEALALARNLFPKFFEDYWE